MDNNPQALLFQPLELPCGVVLKNRIAKSAMSDSLGDGCGNPTEAQLRLYERWAEGGLALSVIGEVQGDPRFAEKPGNLVLRPDSDLSAFEALAQRGSTNGAQLWLQLGHAGAMAHPPISDPKGPSAIDIPGLTCTALEREEILAIPSEFARTAGLAKNLGFGGVQIHAAHGFLLSQFLSPLFNKRDDEFGGSIESRMRLALDVVDEVRNAVGPGFPIGIKLNATDQLEGGFGEQEAAKVIAALDRTGVDLIDISGGTYFPGAKSASDSSGGGPYFLKFAEHARQLTTKPLMLTGGFKTLSQAVDAVGGRCVDIVGLARALAIDPQLPNNWSTGAATAPEFPRFQNPPEGGVTAWFTMRLTELGEDRELSDATRLEAAIKDYDERDLRRVTEWNAHFES
ncbi:MAG: NADH:flavin oxidoreductase/NADH oxidase family protein [Hyphomicrobiaceae bacterium]